MNPIRIKNKSQIDFAEFSKIFKDSVYFRQSKYFKGVESNGVDLSLGFVDVFLIKKMNYIKTFKRLNAYKILYPK